MLHNQNKSAWIDLRPLLLTGLFLATITQGSEPPPSLQANVAWLSEGEYCEPETVLPLPDETLLVSNVCGFREQGNGFLTLLSAAGDAIDWRVVDGLDAPLGMALHNSALYVVDNNQVKVFSWPAFNHLRTLDLETRVANDIAIARDGTIYVTDSAAHAVVRLGPDGSRGTVQADFRFENANGLQVFGNGLYVGGARLWRVDLDNEVVDVIGPDWLADIDGIEFEADGTLQATPVGGPLVRYFSDQQIEVHAGEGISSANHGYLPGKRLALIPTGYDNTVIAIRIGQ